MKQHAVQPWHRRGERPGIQGRWQLVSWHLLRGRLGETGRRGHLQRVSVQSLMTCNLQMHKVLFYLPRKLSLTPQRSAFTIYSEKCLYFMTRHYYNPNLIRYGLVVAEGGGDGGEGRLNFVSLMGQDLCILTRLALNSGCSATLITWGSASQVQTAKPDPTTSYFITLYK